LTQFFAMGGYAAYVWPAYALAVTILAGMLIATLRTLSARRRVERELAALVGRDRRRRRDASA
jgi:heme exporter protein D